MEKNDIIVAAATPPGRSALAIVRISGPGSIKLASELIPVFKDIDKSSSKKIHYGFINDSSGNPIDEITAIPYFAPKSYTTEEMVEIISHGGYLSSRAIISALSKNGARLAEPGEFTKRAFLGGRISLSQAEAVAAAIDAKSELALKAAARNLKGELYDKIDSIRTNIRDLLSLIESEIDFSEEEIDHTSLDKIKNEITIGLDNSEQVLKSYDFGRGLNTGYKIAIVGRANVGKSSLLNALLNRDRAIVTEIPGTTRDTLTEWIEIDGFPILLTDTAGLRESDDHVERIGQDRTKAEIENADLILFMYDLSDGLTDEDKLILETVKNKPCLLIANKIDKASNKNNAIDDLVKISALNGDGLDELKNRVSSALHIDEFELETALLATERQFEAMGEVCGSLTQALDEIKNGSTTEVISIFLRDTLDYLGELVGETTNDDILNNIFDRFCIGK